MAKSASARDKLTGGIKSITFSENKKSAVAQVVFEPIRFVKIKAVTQAALDYANTAVEISLGLIGIMALWLGIMKIAEEAGLIKVLTKMLTPLTRRLFPDVPSDHPAIGAMIMNIAANMLGLSNAATPMGLKAMEELNKLNTKLGTATNAMCTFLVINTSGLTLIPATAIAVRAAAGSANPALIIGTAIFGAACATTAGLIAVKILQRLPRFKKDLETANG
ncbi:MAG: nucleoside recognition protein [Ignavibacteriales bacterium]|nr:nucleoside recognition protein [Ignavibacteriales bacterium]